MSATVRRQEVNTSMPDDESKGGEPYRRRVTAGLDHVVQHLAEKHGLTQEKIRDLIPRVGIDRDELDRAAKELRTSIELSPSGGGHVYLYPPVIESAVGIAARAIRLTWRYRREDLSKFIFRRTNLTYLTTTEFEVAVSPGSTNHVFDDTEGLEPETSYQYRVGAVHPPGDPEAVGVYWNLNQPVTGTTLYAPFEPAFDGALRYDEAGWEGSCLVQRIEPHGLYRSGTQVKLTVRASSASTYGAFIERVYISKPDPAGDPYDSADDLTEVNPKFDIPPGQAVTLPAIRYNLDKGQPLLVAVDFKTPPWPSAITYRPVKRYGPRLQPLLPVGVAYWHAGEEAALRNRSANYSSANRIYLIEKIEVR